MYNKWVKYLLSVIGYARNLWPYYVGVAAASILVALTGIAVPFVLSAATELIVGVIEGNEASISGALWLAALLFVFDASNAVIRNYGGYLGDMMSARLKSQLSIAYYDHLLKLPQSYFDREQTGTIINRLNRAITEITGFLNIFANNILQMLLTTIITVAIVGFYSWELALMVVLIYPVFLWLTFITSKRWQKLQNQKNLETDIASGRFAEVVSQIRVVKSYVQEELEKRHFIKRYQATVDVTRGQSKYWHNMDVARGVALSVIFFAIFAFIFTQTVTQRFSLPDMVLLITLINALRMPLFSLSFMVDGYQRAVTGSRDFVDVMELEPAIADRPDAERLSVTEGVIEFNEVGFAYSADEPVLSGVSFSIKQGEEVALVGESGVGKSTLSNLLMRLYDVTEGSITVDGQNITEVSQKSLRDNIATVFQDSALFSGTVRENIAYARPDASLDEVIAAAKDANAHEFIDKFENGYDTEIGERGIKLSGGQKQRVAIARAILKNAPILILDEATSSLDSRSEKLVQEALDRLTKGRTTLIIAHRLSTIAGVDRIITLKNGGVDEIGTPAELSRTGGIYAQLLELQLGSGESSKQKLRSYDIAA